MNIFVSYTRNDGVITDIKLKILFKFLSDNNNVFIHAIESTHRSVDQAEVINNLMNSDVVLLLFTDGCLISKWVNLEVELSNYLNIPIVTVDAKKLRFQ
ncbi:hypothetical protein [Kluyvera intermedia]|uniref:TIR domain-containing protein n=1 Tax=Kluyvera intermedia TaxID=61648 RepID=A0ABX6DLD4_KLUIN|nr:hypothetical protein [Kluyvera intermedia]QGH28252.1 hypothetical protein GHC21_00635 [Kluyvera intermedia]QGH37234.1 hypothetical protein GHC38_00635 [Kluyvera intermedia]